MCGIFDQWLEGDVVGWGLEPANLQKKLSIRSASRGQGSTDISLDFEEDNHKKAFCMFSLLIST